MSQTAVLTSVYRVGAQMKCNDTLLRITLVVLVEGIIVDCHITCSFILTNYFPVAIIDTTLTSMPEHRNVYILFLLNCLKGDCGILF